METEILFNFFVGIPFLRLKRRKGCVMKKKIKKIVVYSVWKSEKMRKRVLLKINFLIH